MSNTVIKSVNAISEPIKQLIARYKLKWHDDAFVLNTKQKPHKTVPLFQKKMLVFFFFFDKIIIKRNRGRIFLVKRKLSCTMQHDASDCAAAVISTILLHYKSEMTIMKIREIIGTDAYGTSVQGMVEGLEKLHFKVKAIRSEVEFITKDITLPAIAHVHTKEGLNHFVVIHEVKGDVLTIADPAKGIEKQSKQEFSNQFTGVLIVLIPTSEFERMNFKNSSMWDLFKSLIFPQKKLLILTIVASVLLTIFGILSSLFSKVLMDEIIPYQLRNTLFVFLLVFGIISLLQILLSAFRQHVLLYLSRKIDLPLLMGYYDHIIHLPYQFFITRKVGDVLTRFQDAMTIKDIFTSVSISLVLDISLAFITGIILFNMNSNLFFILVIMVCINIVLIYLFKKPYKKLNYEQMEAGAMLNAQLIESIKNIETVKSQGDEQSQLDKLETKFVSSLMIGYREGVLKNVQGSISSFAGTLGNLVFMAIGALAIIDGKMSIGDLLVFQSLSQYFTEPIQNLVGLQLTFQEASIAMKRLNELMSLEREDVKQEYELQDIDIQGDIVFQDVSFSYGSRPPVIENFNLKIKHGQKIAFVGESGAGKSTLARLLLKFIEPKSGKISMNGYDLQDISQKFLRENTAYLGQNIELFTGTILDNLKVGNPNATYEEMIEACRKTGAHTFIEKMPNRYGAFIEENGSNLSGGEKQRLALARALLSKPMLYIFDEATSNLDSFSEQHVQNMIFSSKGKTVVIIAHRLSTIVSCDVICFLEGGSIIERGSHEQLMQLNGKYAQMIRLQTMRYQSSEEMEEEEVAYA